MNRLWVRLSLVISGMILVFTLIPLVTFLFFVLTHDPPTSTVPPPAAPGIERPAPDPAASAGLGQGSTFTIVFP